MKNIILTFTLFISLLSIGEILIYYYYDKENKKSERELDYIGNNITKTIQNEISISSSATFINELMLKANNYNTKEFENWAPLILSNYKSISNIQLAPNGIVKKVYPLKGNEKAIGHNLLTDEKRRIAAIKAMESGKLTFIGPIKLIQNNKQAIIVRKPISKDGNFWGFSTVLISVNDMFEDIFKDLDHEAFNYTIYGYNPDASKLPLLKSSINQPSTNSKKYTIEVPNGSWYLYLEDKNKNLTKFVIFSILVLIISFVISFVSYKYLRNLDNENKKFKLLLKNAIDGIHIIDLKGNLVHASESFYKSLGYTYKEALKLHLTSFYKHLSKKQIKKLFKKVRKGEDLKLQTKLTRKDNSTFDAEVVARIITIDDYKYIYLSEKDITTKLRLESELKDINENLELRVKEATKKLNHSLEIINKYVINSKTDLEGNITEVTDRFCEVSKFKKEELIGKNHNITRHPDVPDSFFKELWETIKSGKTWYGIIQNRTKTTS